MSTPTKIRWYGNPDEDVQPDAGDVLSYVDRTGRKPDWFHLVHYAWRVRGGEPHDLWLMVERLDFGPGGAIPDAVIDAIDNGHCFDAKRLSRRRWRK